MKSIVFYICILLLTWFWWTCKDDIVGGDISDIVFPDSNVSYSHHVEPLFLRTCAIPGCHVEETKNQAGGLSLETYFDATETVGIIIRGDPDGSLLVKAIEGRAPGIGRMPLYRPPLNSNQINGIRQWIKEGAQNN